MHIDEFAEITKKELENFVAKWKAEHAKGKEIFDERDKCTYEEAWPLDMGEGEWFESFMFDVT